MSWDLRILGRPVADTPDQIVEALRARGVELIWTPRNPDAPDELRGYFVDSDPPTVHQIRIHVEAPEYLEEFAEEYDLPLPIKSAIEAAQADYWIGIEADYDDAWVRVAAELVGYLAERSDGVVFDPVAGEFLRADEWRQRHGGGR